MLIKLTKFELLKRWKASNKILLGYVLIQILLFILLKILAKGNNIELYLSDSNKNNIQPSVPIVLFFYSMSSIFICFFPFIEGIYRYDKDLSGNQSVLELMLPANSWKKILSKVFSTAIFTVIFTAIGSISIYIVTASLWDIKPDLIQNLLSIIYKNPREVFLLIYTSLSVFLSIYMLLIFCTSLSRCFSKNNKTANILSAIALVVTVALIVVIDIQISKLPSLTYSFLNIKTNLNSDIFSLVVLVGFFYGSSWLMEKKIQN